MYSIRETLKLECGRSLSILLFEISLLFSLISLIPGAIFLMPLINLLAFPGLWIYYIPIVFSLFFLVCSIFKFIESLKLRKTENPLLTKSARRVIQIFDYLFALLYIAFVIISRVGILKIDYITISLILLGINALYYFVLRSIVSFKLKKVDPCFSEPISLNQMKSVVGFIFLLFYAFFTAVVICQTELYFVEDMIPQHNYFVGALIVLIYIVVSIVNYFLIKEKGKKIDKFYILVFVFTTLFLIFNFTYLNIIFSKSVVEFPLIGDPPVKDMNGLANSNILFLLHLPMLGTNLAFIIPMLIIIHKKSTSNKTNIIVS